MRTPCELGWRGVTPMAIKRTKKADPVHVVVKVDGRRWRRVLSLSGSRSDDRHYVLETRPNGSATVQFGDGAHGASASKASRVEITYRTGGGGAGNVRLCLRRTARPTRDLALWVAIRNRTHAVNFEKRPAVRNLALGPDLRLGRHRRGAPGRDQRLALCEIAAPLSRPRAS